MNYGNKKKTDIADGEGVRVTLFVSGCRIHCPGCFQPQTWDFNFGKEFTEETQIELLEALKPPYIAGLTVLGGEPFEPENQRGLLPLIRRVKRELPEKTIWMFTGFVYDRDLIPGGRKHCEVTEELLESIDVLVDGPFLLAEKDISLRFRGSRNQRLIDMRRTRREGSLVLSEYM